MRKIWPTRPVIVLTAPDADRPAPVLIATVSVFCFLTLFAIACVATWLYRRKQRQRSVLSVLPATRSDKPSRSRSTRGPAVVTPYHTDSDTDGTSPTTSSGVSLLRSGSSARPMLDVSDTVTFASRGPSLHGANTYRASESSQHSPLSAVRPPVSQTTGTALDRVDEDTYSTFGDVARAAPFDFNSAPPYTLEAVAGLPPSMPQRAGVPLDSVLTPPPPAYADPSDASIRRGRPASARSLNTRSSLATEDDDDALAQDGSSLARTLTTESSGTIMSFSTRRRSDTSGRHYGHHEERRTSYTGSEQDETSTATWTDEDSYGGNDTDSDVVVAGPGLIRRPTTTTYNTHSGLNSALSAHGTFLSPFADSSRSSATSVSSPTETAVRQQERSTSRQRDDPFADPAKDNEVRSFDVGDDRFGMFRMTGQHGR